MIARVHEGREASWFYRSSTRTLATDRKRLRVLCLTIGSKHSSVPRTSYPSSPPQRGDGTRLHRVNYRHSFMPCVASSQALATSVYRDAVSLRSNMRAWPVLSAPALGVELWRSYRSICSRLPMTRSCEDRMANLIALSLSQGALPEQALNWRAGSTTAPPLPHDYAPSR